MRVLAILKVMTVSSAMRLMKNTSPRSGCIKLMVHAFFGTIIVISFVMILLMTMRTHKNSEEVIPRCVVNQCNVLCRNVDFNNNEEYYITIAASEMASNCRSISLDMIQPLFINGILPENWLATVRANIRELSIIDGNLNHISPREFMDPVSDNIRILVFERIKITTLIEDTFLGLSNIREIYIRDCTIEYVKENALQAVDDTLKLLNIKAAHTWNPVNVTGSSNFLKLEQVNFSFNKFYNVLNKATFSSLHACEVLYLNSCKINFIGIGTFDALKNLRVLYLNDNSLVTIPPGLFDTLLTSETIRIALHENFWLCSCTQNDLRTLHAKDIIIVEPICYYPDLKHGLTFSELEEYCDKNISKTRPPPRDRRNKNNLCTSMSISTIIQNNEACYKDRVILNDINNFLPSIYLTCISHRIKENFLNKTFDFGQSVTNSSKTWSWLRPVYFSQYKHYSMMELVVTGKSSSGIVWYQNNNKHEVYCINAIPDILQVYFTDVEEEYTFCLFDIKTSKIHSDKCLNYKMSDFGYESSRRISVLFNYVIYMSVAFVCLLCGATCVFIIINRNPALLKRNKRILFVKHKTIDALILPPDIPLRKDALESTGKIDLNNDKEEKIFVLPRNDLLAKNFERSISMRSGTSNDASYISALSPTEEQLHKWRSCLIDKDCKQTSEEDVSSFSSLYESLPYYSLQDKVYETIK